MSDIMESSYTTADDTIGPMPDDSENKQQRLITAIILGVGHRGFGYGLYSLEAPSKLKIVGVADPDKVARNRAKQIFEVSDENVFDTWEQVVEKERLADVAIICTQDQMHKEPAVAMAKKGYHILLEKPMAVTQEDCELIVNEVKKNKVMFGVCHVLRYYPQFKIIRELIQSGAIGEIVNIEHTEPVGFWHFAHSYVRGNWRNESMSSSSLLAKCCHDLDLISYWMDRIKCTKISSFGALMHFTKDNKPEGAADRCFDCSVHESCPYSAQKIYLNRGFRWPVSVVVQTTDIEDLHEALKTGPYGRCVYNCDNDVMSNQVVSMQFENGATASVSMVGFSKRVCDRQTIISGTHGEITCDFVGPVKIFDFASKTEICHSAQQFESVKMSGHNGADYHLIHDFIEAIGTNDPTKILAGPDDALYSHKLVFAAEQSRKENKIVFLNNDF